MHKKSTLVLLCTLIMLLCSGCALTDQMNRMLNPDSAYNKNQSILSELKSTSMSKETAEAGKKAADAYAKLDRNTVTKNPFKAIFSSEYCLPSSYARMEKKAAKASSEYAVLYSTDDVIKQQRDREQLAEEEQNSKSLWERIFGTNTKRDSSKSNSNMTMIIILVVVVLIVIVVLLLLNKRGRATPKKATPKKIEQKAIENEHTEIKDVKVGADLKVNYDKLLDQACTKLNLDKEEMLRKYDGDARRAYEATNLM